MPQAMPQAMQPNMPQAMQPNMPQAMAPNGVNATYTGPPGGMIPNQMTPAYGVDG